MKPAIRILLAALFCAAFFSPAQAVTFKIATLAPAGTDWMKEMKRGAKSIAEKTEDRVKLKFYPGGVMGSEQSVLRKIRIGQLQGGAFSSGGLADIFPDIQLLNLPMLFDSFDEVDYVRARMLPVMEQNLEERGFVLLGVAEAGFTRIFSAAPIRDLDAIRKSKLWAPEGDLMVEETYRSMGLSPVFLPISDVYTGLQTGLIDTVTTTPSAAIAFQWHSNLRYVTDTPLAYLVGLLAIDKRAFDRVDAADQAIVREEVARVVESLDKITREGNRRAAQALQNQGFVFVEPGDEEIAHWRQLADESVERLIDEGALTRDGVRLVRQQLCDYRNGSRQ
jgi:TRAP-type C4-dicarboxylate transport system substrate-binding protein